MSDEIVEKLKEWTVAYHDAMERALEARGRWNFQYHGGPSQLVRMFRAANGFVTFYLPHPTSPTRSTVDGFPVDRFFHDLSAEHDLNTICQSVSACHLRVLPASPGEPVNYPPGPIAALEPVPIPMTPVPWLNEDLRQAFLNGTLRSLPIWQAIPELTYSGDDWYIMPQRKVLWSPVYVFPRLGARRLFSWARAEFWWTPQGMLIDPAHASLMAEQDLLTLDDLLRRDPVISPEIAQQTRGTSQAGPIATPDQIEADCDELAALLDEAEHKKARNKTRKTREEEMLHQWLYKHPIFLEPHFHKVWSKVPFGSKFSDFVVRRSDGTYLLVEIEPATSPVFNKGNQEPTHEFTHARGQIDDWLQYIKDNVHTVRHELGLEGIYEPKGMVIIGRDKHIQGTEAQRRWQHLKNAHQNAVFTFFTYDEILERARAYASNLRFQANLSS